MGNNAIAFVAAPSSGGCQAHVAEAATLATAPNMEHGASTVVVYDDHRYLTYVEGSAQAVEAALAHASTCPVHTELVELARGPVHSLRFPDVSLLLLPASEEELRALVRADWINFSQRLGSRVEPATGMERLAALVERSTATA